MTDTHVFIQYKNTDICFDFYCDCGAQSHYDGYFAYVVKCAACGVAWSMPSILPLRRATEVPERRHDDPDRHADYEFHGEATGYSSIGGVTITPEWEDEYRWKPEEENEDA